MCIKLSICIATLNRASFIGATLESIVSQATDDCEIVVLDGGSTDQTERVVSSFEGRFTGLRYVKQETNHGIDRDFDRAVELARGEYCWLFSDDDLLKPGAIAMVLQALHSQRSLILVNGEHRDFSMTDVRIPSFFDIDADRTYLPDELDRLFVELGRCLICICCVVIRRDVWLARERGRYYGTRFVHIGVIFQKPLPGKTFAIAAPLMSLRLDNEQTHAAEGFKVWFISLPSLVWSLPLSKSTKMEFCGPEPWRALRYVLARRARGGYSWAEYQRWVRPQLRSYREALVPVLVVCLPRKLAHFLYVSCSMITGWPRAPGNALRSIFPRSWNRFVDAAASPGDGGS